MYLLVRLRCAVLKKNAKHHCECYIGKVLKRERYKEEKGRDGITHQILLLKMMISMTNRKVSHTQTPSLGFGRKKKRC